MVLGRYALLDAANFYGDHVLPRPDRDFSWREQTVAGFRHAGPPRHVPGQPDAAPGGAPGSVGRSWDVKVWLLFGAA